MYIVYLFITHLIKILAYGVSCCVFDVSTPMFIYIMLSRVLSNGRIQATEGFLYKYLWFLKQTRSV